MENTNRTRDIAIIGMSGRFPGANSLPEFWDNLCKGKESISSFSDQELMDAGIPPETFSRTNYLKYKAILEKSDLFDADFFGFSPREAEALDPQQRLFLECAWEALEDSGYYSESNTCKIGVYAGSGMNNYYPFHLLQNRKFKNQVSLFQLMTSNMPDALCTRVSYKFNLTGPSYTIQTACSTSLVAVAVACQALLNFQCDLALAGGVSLPLPIISGYLYKEGMILSPDGHCRPFDQKAAGTVLGMGCGAVVLKRLDDAIKDRDSIYAVIKGFSINNDGSNKIGYTAPSTDGQINVISEAQGMANINLETISYIETHGTGTKLGDPIEIMALTQAFRESTDKKQFCAIGSLKSNIGHLDAAAGIAGLIKVTLSLQHKLLPPTLHFQEPNSHINFEDSPFYVNAELLPWKSPYPRRAGVSAFGIGGTNAHMILEESPTNQRQTDNQEWHLFILSTKTSDALEMATHNLFNFLKENPTLNISDVAYTLAVGRKPFNYRRMFVLKDKDALLNNNKGILTNRSTDNQTMDLKDLEKEINHILSINSQELLDGNYNQLCQVILQKSAEHSVNLSCVVEQKDLFDKADFLFLLGKLWLKGAKIEWDLIYSSQKPSRVPLPTYPFQRKRYWIEPDKPDISISEGFAEDITPTTASTEQTLIKIWQSHFGIQKIHPTDNFFTLGGDSLLAVDIIYQINQKFACNLTPGALLSSPSIVDLAQQIDSQALSSLPFTVVPLKQGDLSYQPLFLIHPVGGTVYFYRELVSYLPAYQTVYGVQAKSLDGKTPVPRTIEEMARAYVQDILSVQTQGTYNLAGASFGGIVAYEMARFLSEAGKQINFLGLIDSPSPGFLPETKDFISVPGIIKYLLEVGEGHHVPLDYLLNLSEEELVDYFIENSKTKVEDFKNQAKLFFEMFRLNMEAMLCYVPRIYNGKVVFFKALEENPYIPKNLEYGWQPFVKKGLDVIGIPGNHLEMNRFPHVKKLASHLQVYIREHS